MHEGDEEVLVVEKSGEQSDALLYIRPCCVISLLMKDNKVIYFSGITSCWVLMTSKFPKSVSNRYGVDGGIAH